MCRYVCRYQELRLSTPSDTVDSFPGLVALHARDRHGGDIRWSYEQYMEVGI